MTSFGQPLMDKHGNVMFRCAYCGAPIGLDDIEEQGLRPPDYGETPEEYLEAELVDAFFHGGCLAAAKAS